MDKLKAIGLMIIICLVAVLTFTPMAMAEQGDKVWTASPPLATAALGTSGEGYVRGVAFPYESNGQFVITMIEAVTNAAGESWEIWAYDSLVTNYQLTTVAFSGGNTNYIHANNAMQSLAGSGVSYFALVDASGNIGFGMFLDAAGTGTGDIIEVDSAVSSFAYGPGKGAIDLSGVTFASGSRVFPLTQRAVFPTITADTIRTATNSEGLFAGPRGSPVVVLNEDATTGNTLFGVTGKFK